MKRIIILLTMLLSFNFLVYSFSLKIDKVKINEKAKPGQIIQGVVNVINDKNTPMHIFTGIEDYILIAKEQSVKFAPYGTEKDSCSKWITFLPNQLKIAPNTSQSVQYTINVPANEDFEFGEYYSLLFVETSPKNADLTTGMVVKSRARMGINVKIKIEGFEKPSGKIKDIKVTQSEDDELIIDYIFLNDGNSFQKVTGLFSIIDKEGNLFGRGTIMRGVSKPGDEISISTKWEGDLDPGEYDLILEIRYFPDVIEIKEVPFKYE